MKVYLIEVDSRKIGIARERRNNNGIEYFLRRDERTYNDFVRKDSMSLEEFNLLMDQLENDLNYPFSMIEVLENYEGHEHISFQEESGVKNHYYGLVVSSLERDLVKATVYYTDGGMFYRSVRGKCVVSDNTIRIEEGGGNSTVLYFDEAKVKKININGVDFYGKGE